MSKCVTCPRPVLVFAPGDAPSLWGQEESAVTKLSALSRPHAQERDGERTGISRLLCHDVLGDVERLTLLPGQAKVQCCFSLLSDLWHLTFHPHPPAPSLPPAFSLPPSLSARHFPGELGVFFGWLVGMERTNCEEQLES